jgi:hypothetical protein
MQRISNRMMAPLFALLLAASLAFGVGSALAQPAAAAACPYNPGSGQIGVSCTVRANCTAPCQAAYPGSPGGVCSGGCCVCAY